MSVQRWQRTRWAIETEGKAEGYWARGKNYMRLRGRKAISGLQMGQVKERILALF